MKPGIIKNFPFIFMTIIHKRKDIQIQTHTNKSLSTFYAKIISVYRIYNSYFLKPVMMAGS